MVSLETLISTSCYDITKTNIMAKKKDNDPCWKNYEQVGMKTKEGKKVPNCVPKKSTKSKT